MRTYRRLRVQLKKRDRDELDRVLNGDIQPVGVVLRSLALCQLHEGKSISEAAANVHLTSKAVREIGRRYEESGLERALYDKQRPGRPRAVDRPVDRRGSGETQTGPQGGAGNDPDSSPQPRVQTVAGKKCGRCPNSTKSTSPEWRTSCRPMKSLTIPKSRYSVWTKSRLRSMLMSGLLHRLCRAARRGRMVNTSAAGRPMSSVLWSLRLEDTLPLLRRIARPPSSPPSPAIWSGSIPTPPRSISSSTTSTSITANH